jgi:hypothetical protein
MSKYEPLKRFLAAQSAPELPLSFTEVEEALGCRLPESARQYAPWWANENDGGHVQARAWLEAGWKTSRVDVSGERVVFVRASPRTVAPTEGSSDPSGQELRMDLGALSPAAARLLMDYSREAGGDVSKAVARGLHDAAIARRGRLIDAIAAQAPRTGLDSVSLIREDRDGR